MHEAGRAGGGWVGLVAREPLVVRAGDVDDLILGERAGTRFEILRVCVCMGVWEGKGVCVWGCVCVCVCVCMYV